MRSLIYSQRKILRTLNEYGPLNLLEIEERVPWGRDPAYTYNALVMMSDVLGLVKISKWERPSWEYSLTSKGVEYVEQQDRELREYREKHL